MKELFSRLNEVVKGPGSIKVTIEKNGLTRCVEASNLDESRHIKDIDVLILRGDRCVLDGIRESISKNNVDLLYPRVRN